MATERQLAANRANAKRSTGPKTKTGQYTSSRNAVRHGLASQDSHQYHPIDIQALAQALIEPEADQAQIVSARQAVHAHAEILRVRAISAALLASFDPKGCNIDDLCRLQALDRYERIARGKRRRATQRL